MSWDLVAPYRDNPAFRQLRPAGKLLMCFEMDNGSFHERAAVQQRGCAGEQHQYFAGDPVPAWALPFEENTVASRVLDNCHPARKRYCI
ncbi:MAG: hypothetical protein ACREQL_00480 [Candidatus Binatia bacterium]